MVLSLDYDKDFGFLKLLCAFSNYIMAVNFNDEARLNKPAKWPTISDLRWCFYCTASFLSKVSTHFLPYPCIRGSYMTYRGFDIPNLMIAFFYDSWVPFFFLWKMGGGHAVVQKETFKYLQALWMSPRFSFTLSLS